MGGPSWETEGKGWEQNLPQHAPCSLIPPQIIFEGVRGSGYLGDIAIDDVTLKKGECPRKQMDPNKGAGQKVGGVCLCQGRCCWGQNWGSEWRGDGVHVLVAVEKGAGVLGTHLGPHPGSGCGLHGQ